MKGMDLSKFKKMTSDKASTTLRHPDGHVIKIAHHSLNAKMREELNKLPIHKAEGGQVKHYAEGTPDEPVTSENLPTDSKPQDQSAPAPQVVAPQAPVVINVGAQPIQAPTPVSAAPIAPETPTPAPAAAAPMPQIAAPQAPEAPVQSALEPVAAPEAQAQAPAQVPEAPVQAPVAAPQAPEAKTQELEQKPMNQDIKDEAIAWENDLNNGHITPKTYSEMFASKSTLGKLGTLFGLMIGGAGSGLTHQPNAVAQMMDNEINNDLAAQTKSKDNAQNYIRLNQAHQLNQAQIKKMVQEGKLTDSQASLITADAKIKVYAQSQIEMLQSTFHSFVEKTNMMPEGAQKEMAKQTLATLYSKVGEKINNIADQAAGAAEYNKLIFGNGNGGGSGGSEEGFQKKMSGMRMLGPQGEMRAKDIEEKHFPGLKGQASIPLTGEDRSKINSGMDFDQKLHRFMDWTKNHSGDLSPSDRNAGQALASELQGAYRQATAGGVYKEGEQNFISKLIDSTPTKFFNSVRVLPQLKAIAGENQAKVNQLVKSKGFQGYSNPAMHSSYADVKRSATSGASDSSSEIRTMNGIEYKKVNSGWQRVK